MSSLNFLDKKIEFLKSKEKDLENQEKKKYYQKIKKMKNLPDDLIRYIWSFIGMNWCKTEESLIIKPIIDYYKRNIYGKYISFPHFYNIKFSDLQDLKEFSKEADFDDVIRWGDYPECVDCGLFITEQEYFDNTKYTTFVEDGELKCDQEYYCNDCA
jgi:capsid portal protein